VVFGIKAWEIKHSKIQASQRVHINSVRKDLLTSMLDNHILCHRQYSTYSLPVCKCPRRWLYSDKRISCNKILVSNPSKLFTSHNTKQVIIIPYIYVAWDSKYLPLTLTSYYITLVNCYNHFKGRIRRGFKLKSTQSTFSSSPLPLW